MERAGRGHGEIVALVGEPGVGKSRLVWEFTHSHRLQGWRVLESASVSYGKATAYRPLIDLMRGYFQIGDTDDARRIREKVTGKLLTLDETFEPTSAGLPRRLLDVPFENPEWQGLATVAAQAANPGGLQAASVEREPGSAAGGRVRGLALDRSPRHRRFWTAWWTGCLHRAYCSRSTTGRSTRIDWTRKTYYTRLRIDPLPAESAEELLAGMLGDAEELQPLRRDADRAH